MAVAISTHCLILSVFFNRYQSAQHVQALQATQYQQMGNAGYFMENSTEDKVMTELAVHQEPPTHQDLSVHCEPAVCPDPPVPASVQSTS